MRLSYLFFHVRPFLMVAAFPLILASQTDAAPLASYAGRMSAIVIFAVGLAIFLWSHWQVYKPAQWPEISCGMGDEEASRSPPQVSEKNLEECRLGTEEVFLCGKEVLFPCRTEYSTV